VLLISIQSSEMMSCRAVVLTISFDIDDGVGAFELRDCDLPHINSSYNLDVSLGTFAMTMIDWTDDPNPDCTHVVHHTISYQDPVTSVDVSTLPEIAIRNETEIQLAFWLYDGTDIIVSSDWDDGTILSTCQLTVTVNWTILSTSSVLLCHKRRFCRCSFFTGVDVSRYEDVLKVGVAVDNSTGVVAVNNRSILSGQFCPICHMNVADVWTILSTSGISVHDVTVVSFVHVYNVAGNFTVSGSVRNLVSGIPMENHMISVYGRIHDLLLFGNSSVLTPPGTGIWGVMTGPEQFPLENIICLWNMGSSYSDMTYDVALINLTIDHEITFSYAFEADVGKHTISVNCSNAVSSQKLTMDVNVIWDNVTLGELACNSSTLWNHSITCQLNIVRFGTGACFEWDMGDRTALVYYQDAYCAVDVSAASPKYVQVTHFLKSF